MASVNNLPQVQASAMQTAVLPPPAASNGPGAAAQRRSFKNFVDAMDDFSFDRRDVAGMRQALAMREDAERAAQAAAKQVPQGAVLRSFAPDQTPDVPVVRGPAAQGPASAAEEKAPAIYDPYAAMPKVNPQAMNASPFSVTSPENRAEQSGALPSLPGLPPQSTAPAPTNGNDVPRLVIDPSKINPAAGAARGERIVGYMPIKQTSAMAPTVIDAATTQQAAVAADQDLPAQLRSPMVDQVRQATRSGARPGLSEDAVARMNAAYERKRAMAPPMPPQLMAQEVRWNRDAWSASVNGLPSLPQAPVAVAAQANAAQQASVLPRLPGAP